MPPTPGKPFSSDPFEPPPKYLLLGVGISRINLRTGTEAVVAAARGDGRGYITVTGVHGVMEAQDDPGFKEILNGSLMTTPDGMPAVWGGWVEGYSEMSRVYGPDLMLEVMKVSARHGLRHFFYGGKEGVADLLKTKLEERFPGVRVVGTYCPPFRELTAEENLELECQVRDAAPDIIWVGLSTPKQERFMAAYMARLDTKLMIGVGAAFDFHAGLLKQAPPAMQGAGLEWLYRLAVEPRRLWSRYSKIVPGFIRLAGLGMAGSALRLWFGFRTLPPLLCRSQAWVGVFAAAGTVAGVWVSGMRLPLAGTIIGSCAVMAGCAVCSKASVSEDKKRNVGLPVLLWILATAGTLAVSVAPFAHLLHLQQASRAAWVAGIILTTAALLGWIGALAVVVVAVLRHRPKNDSPEADVS